MTGQMLVLLNGRFYTLDDHLPAAQAMVVRDGRILALGDNDEMRGITEKGAEIVDLDGRCVTPGLVDAHVHFRNFSLARRRVDLDNAGSLEEVLARIAAYAADERNIEQSGWLRGRGWSQGGWTERRFPTAADMDRLVSHAPACMIHKSGHAAWVNNKALQLAGITRMTPDPPSGEIQRDASGNPTGILFEEAMALVNDLIPPAAPEEVANAMRDAQQYCWTVGLTGLHDFDGRSCFLALQQLHRNGELGLRVVKNIPVARLEYAVGVGLQSGFGDDWLRVGGIKIFADGALGPRTAAMVEPYENDPDNSGIVVTDKEEMMAAALQASANGLSVTIHAIGDRANHDVLDVYEAVRSAEAGGRRLRHRIEHVQLLHPRDLTRLAELNIIASMQPLHATSDMEMADAYWGERTRYAYAIRTMLDSGAAVVFGSDAPIEVIDPLQGIHAAVTRRRANGAPGPQGWHPEQRLTIREAIHGFTSAAAFTAGVEARLGTLSPGKAADMTIFERDIFTMAPDELLGAGIAGTIIDGRFRYRAW
ncbi:MAG: amidohydrolase [Candidatus Promineifilaceae bacterium]